MRGNSIHSEGRAPGGRAPGPVFGLALGGGALLGLAHVGVLEALEARGLRPDLVTGTSIGALVAACFAGGMPIADMKRTALAFNWKRVRRRKMIPTMAIYSSEPMREFLAGVLPCTDFDRLDIPVGFVATDLRTAQMVVFGSRNLEALENADDDIVVLKTDMIEALRASCTVPVLFEPVELEGRILVDGFLTNNVPAGVARAMGADIVLAVDLQQRRAMYPNPSNIFEYTMQSQMIYRYWSVKNRRIWADLVLRPDLVDYGWDDTDRINDIIAAGREAALEKLPELEGIIARAAATCREKENPRPADGRRSAAL